MQVERRATAAPLARAAAVLGAGAALLACAPSPAASLATLRTPGPYGAVPADLSAPLVAVIALGAWLLVAWLIIATLLTLASRLPGCAGRATAPLTSCLVPRAVRRGLELALGLTVATTAVWASPAVAADGAGAQRPAGVKQTAAMPSLDWPVVRQSAATPSADPQPAETSPTPASPAPAPVTSDPPAATGQTTSAPATSTPARPAPAATSDRVVVSAGDTLWSLAERSLGDTATDARVAATWPSWWEANREAIGDDPDLLHPGQALSAPPSTPGR